MTLDDVSLTGLRRLLLDGSIGVLSACGHRTCLVIFSHEYVAMKMDWIYANDGALQF